jgi:hypothetical protein
MVERIRRQPAGYAFGAAIVGQRDRAAGRDARAQIEQRRNIGRVQSGCVPVPADDLCLAGNDRDRQ